MNVARLHAGGDLRIHTEPAPAAGEGETIVRVTAVGICGSDLHWFEEAGIGDARLDRPLVLGHEFAGVAEAGPLKDRIVAVDPAVPCGACDFCLEGHPNLCEHVRFSGHGAVDGALRERMAWPGHCLFPLPDAFDAVDGAMLEPLGVAIHAVDLAHLRPGATVGVFGCGPIGLLTLQYVVDLACIVAGYAPAATFGKTKCPSSSQISCRCSTNGCCPSTWSRRSFRCSNRTVSTSGCFGPTIGACARRPHRGRPAAGRGPGVGGRADGIALQEAGRFRRPQHRRL